MVLKEDDTVIPKNNSKHTWPMWAAREILSDTTRSRSSQRQIKNLIFYVQKLLRAVQTVTKKEVSPQNFSDIKYFYIF